MSKLTDQFKAMRRSGTPIVGITTADPFTTISEIRETQDESQVPIVIWDSVRGAKPLTEIATQMLAGIPGSDATDPFMPPEEALVKTLTEALQYSGRAILFLMNVHHYLANPKVAQAIWLLRDPYKHSPSRTLVLLGPSLQLPPELTRDVIVLDEPLPSDAELERVVLDIYKGAQQSVPELAIPEAPALNRIVQSLRGLSGFGAEQVAAMSMTRTGIRPGDLWDYKRGMISQTRGISIDEFGENYDDIGGLAQIKHFTTRVFCGPKPPSAVVFIDEIEKMLAGSGPGGDTSGVSQDALGVLLREMEDNKWTGMVLVGPPGCQPAGSKVLMADGKWKNIEDVVVGDYVLSPQKDGSSVPAQVLRTSQFNDRPIYRVRTVGRRSYSYRCSEDHILPICRLVRHRNGNLRRRETVIEELTVAEFLKRGKEFRDKARVFTCPPCSLPDQPLYIHPYVVGCLLGNGALGEYHQNGSKCIKNPGFTTSDTKVISRLEELGVTFGKKTWIKGCYHLNITGLSAKRIRESEISGCLAHDKFIPEVYKRASLPQRLDLLAGLIDTDGSRNRSSCEYSSVSCYLAKDFADLVHSVGGACSIRERTTYCDGKPFKSFRINYSFADYTPPVQVDRKCPLPRDMSRKNPRNHKFTVELDGRAKVYGFTIEGDSQWYITDDWLVTHNSGKSVMAQSTGSQFEVPIIRMDMGAAKGSLVGESEQRIRDAMKVVKGVAGSSALFLATSNRLSALPPELLRRFRLGIWFFDLPTPEERESIWRINLKKFGHAQDAKRPYDDGYSGADIRNTCEVAQICSCTLEEASQFVTPVSRTDPQSVEAIRQLANKRFLSASYPGVYDRDQKATITGRAIDLSESV